MSATVSTLNPDGEPSHLIADAFDGWYDEVYLDGRAAGADRALDVKRSIDSVLLPALARHGVVTIDDLIRHQYREVLKDLAGVPDRSGGTPVLAVVPAAPASGDASRAREKWYTLDQAITVTKADRSTIRRRLADGKLPKTKMRGSQQVYARSDLEAAGLMTGQALRRGGAKQPGQGYSTSTLKDLRWILDQALEWGVEELDWTLSFRLDKVKTPKSRQAKPPQRGPLTMTEAATLATQLHAVFQVTLWLCRILGLRISEAYGVRIGDVYDHPDGSGRGILRVLRQGGKTFHRWATEEELQAGMPEIITSGSVNRTKTQDSRRGVIVPVQLMVLIDLVVRIFHTAADGTVDVHARLIPGLKFFGEAGQAGFLEALRKAAVAVGISVAVNDDPLADPDDEVFVAPVPHDMRRAVVTDFQWADDLDGVIARRYVGHIAATDVHGGYIKDDPTLAHLTGAAAVLEQQIAEQVPGGLVIPTALRCTTGAQPALAVDGPRIDAALVECGWLVQPLDLDSEPLLDTKQVAELCSVTTKTARQWLREGLIPSVIVASTMRDNTRRARLNDVETFATQRAAVMDLARLATELGQDYHRLYQWVRNRGLGFQRQGNRLIVPPDTEAELRKLSDQVSWLSLNGFRLSEACHDLSMAASVVERLVHAGTLVRLPIQGPDNAWYISEFSMAAYAASRGIKRRGKA